MDRAALDAAYAAAARYLEGLHERPVGSAADAAAMRTALAPILRVQSATPYHASTNRQTMRAVSYLMAPSPHPSYVAMVSGSAGRRRDR